ncbi:hypothetical protein CHLNCDRAFT_53969 [Chlorella variabilis]|uniref:Serine decarboxylase n=1 Tax=Chlorella variabilis TaxID=554065 RepID=E1ZLH7_CHLVA|nr:hypothetical protein CHLNCDRAFT_53969 [Chlorella variabilis]EFN53269.1 hypothetical protein CHLNCDRAFT_53969 [Chlorella variabilis]|eukprot:XP_005845371.1 hypothetical protein CHLNCDRAFT_53969 [Chlorella variabilis]
MEDILPLVRTAKLPSPVLKPAVPREDSASAESVVQQQDAAPGSPRLAPYQALPVTKSTIITHNITPALPVLEPGELDKEELEARINKVIDDYKEKLQLRTDHHMGYPYNLDFDYGPLEGLQKYCINNLGDPFIESNYGVHSREFEIGVLQWFARLWEIEVDDFWGYITNCGTEGNLHGILVGREALPDGILYASRETHYSIFKAGRMYRMDAVKVGTLDSGEIDYDELQGHLAANAARPAIININIGTTVKGAVDDLDRETGYTEDRFFIHCDGALFGMMIPFVKRAPMVTFKKPIGSISVSGHKFVGSPVPCGVVMTRLRYIKGVSSDVEYLNSRDATIMGSRNGHAPIYMWYTFTRKGYEGLRKDVEKCLRNAHLLKSMLDTAGVRTMLNELSSTVVFERPREESFVRKWQLACEGDIAHVVVMPNITIRKLETFVQELVESRARVSVAEALKLAEDARAHAGDEE